jgi:hypothetical protein
LLAVEVVVAVELTLVVVLVAVALEAIELLLAHLEVEALLKGRLL